MIFTDKEKANFSAMLLTEYGIEISRESEILPILFLMHNYEKKMGSTIATGFGFMDSAGTQLTNSSLKLEALMAEVRDHFKSQAELSRASEERVQSSSLTNLPDTSVAGPGLGSKVPFLLLFIAIIQTLLLVFMLAKG